MIAHPGPEAWYTTAGEVCLETPKGKSSDAPAKAPLCRAAYRCNYCHRHRAATLARAHPARNIEAFGATRTRLDAERTMQELEALSISTEDERRSSNKPFHLTPDLAPSGRSVRRR